MEGSLSNVTEADGPAQPVKDGPRLRSKELVSELPLRGKNGQTSRGRSLESCALTLGSTSSQSIKTIECPSPDDPEVDSAVSADRFVEHSTDNPQELPMPPNPEDGLSRSSLSTSEFSQPYNKVPRDDLLSSDTTIVQAIQEDFLALPLHNDVHIGQNIDTSSTSTRAFGLAKQPATSEPGYESVCPYAIRSWHFGTAIANTEIEDPHICWCNQCFQCEPDLENRICFGNSDGYVEVWTDKPKAAIFSPSAFLCSCMTRPFHSETVTKFDFYKSYAQKLRDNSSKRNYLLSSRDLHILSNRDSVFRRIDSGIALRCPSFGKHNLQPPLFGHLRRSSAPENTVHPFEESSQSVDGTNCVIPEINRLLVKGSLDITSPTLESKLVQSNIPISPEPPVLPREMCWCGDFCWVTRMPRAWIDRSDNRLECRSRIEVKHRVFFSSAGGEIEAWTDIPKPKNAFTGVEKSTCIMAPRHISRVVKFNLFTERLTQSAPKRVHLLNCRDRSNCPTLSLDGSGASNGSATALGKEDPVTKYGVLAPRDCSLYGRGGLQTRNDTRKEEGSNLPSLNLLQLPYLGHQRRSSAPEALENRPEPRIQPSRAKYYRLANGKSVKVKMPSTDV
ncbi:uncharacterized protein A1O5_10338 [Cladophialophora psammophila CBS 110553]|uniref:Uncharacterized protein n=1 Tax=Cladophialophora psammophila CBS 110553 TaxID=1182543 RepID=W9WEX4_9EURO|nr:uncharacterized protein A1O5_10338 [Cladophialophora psammophila CBS 110553]EXJ66667.1 hypothetical protein A1O5_10338 [Cladophialophora psammophila CBS 110553]